MWLARDLMASSPLLGGDKGPSGLLASKPGRILRLQPTKSGASTVGSQPELRPHGTMIASGHLPNPLVQEIPML